MSDKVYVAFGEESARGTKEVSTVGHLALTEPVIPDLEYDDKVREEIRGEESVLGDTSMQRMGRKWSASFPMNFFTEAGTTAAMVGTILKHLMSKVASDQNATTGQYYHMFYPTANPFASANLGDKALTANVNLNEGLIDGGTMKNWPYVGGRPKGVTFDVEPSGHLVMTVEMMGQFRDTTTAELGSPVYPAENLRCDYNNLTCYTGVTRVGTGPDYTDFTFGSAVAFKPDKVSIKIDTGREDKTRLSGVDYPDYTSAGKMEVSVDITIDWNDPASGLSSVDELNNAIAAIAETGLFFQFDTGTVAGTGDNHSIGIDLPRLVLNPSAKPEYSRGSDSTITLSYKGLYDSTTTKYIAGILLKNTAATV